MCRQVGDDVGGTLQKKKKKITRNKTGGHGEVGAVVPVGKRRKKKKKKRGARKVTIYNKLRTRRVALCMNMTRSLRGMTFMIALEGLSPTKGKPKPT